MVTWIVVVVVVVAVLVGVLAVASVFGRLSGLRRAVRRLQLRQDEAVRLQQHAEVLQVTIAGLQERAAVAAGRVAAIRGDDGHR